MTHINGDPNYGRHRIDKADGRAIVYAVLEGAAAWTGSEDHRGGLLLAPGEDIAAALREVGEEVGIPDHIIRQAIAALPAEVI